MPLKLVTPAAEEPVTLAQAKLHLRVEFDDDDALITMLISAARAHAENICRRAFITQSWDLFLDGFPLHTYCGTVPGRTWEEELSSNWVSARDYTVRFRGGEIGLPFSPLQVVASVKYRDPSGNLLTLDPSLYLVDNVSEPGAITPAPDTYWPHTQHRINTVQISYTVGYGDASAVPAGIKAWILMRIGAMYENREEVLVGQRLVVADLPFVNGLLDPYRVMSYA